MSAASYNSNFQGLDTIQKRLFQLIIARLDGDKLISKDYRKKIISLTQKGIGGFILFGGRKEEVRKFIETLQSISEIPLFIASDVERGVGQQFEGSTTFPCPMALASAFGRDEEKSQSLLESMIKAISDEAKDIGINMPLIPVLDVNKNPNNPIICTRSFSDNPETVAKFGSYFIKIIEQDGLLSCGKHFPGHGDTAIDSHISLPVIYKAKTVLMDEDILPFLEAIKLGISSIMVGHLVVTELDSKPASISKKAISDFLRGELGFKGIVLTDALNMGALKGFEKISVEALNAGVDILLHPIDVERTIEELLLALKAKDLKEERIDEALQNIFKAKSKLPMIQKTYVNYSLNKRISQKISEMSISLLKDKPDVIPLKNFERVNVFFFGENESHNLSFFRRYFELQAKTDGEVTIVAINSNISAWKGNSGIDREDIAEIKRIVEKSSNSIIISFGNPYILKHFKDADVLIAAYESSDEAQKSVIKGLLGDISFSGKIPISI
ncbi:MAG: glycoside hydrolase family 3 protein [Thermodesulfovibrionales bacterium]|nr:glycoside hydrolase family 3 protein [Thermodesulfovibrionales bacterium]